MHNEQIIMWASEEIGSWEPSELRQLKHKLAHFSCKCTTCEKIKSPNTLIELAQNDKQVQVKELKNCYSDRSTQVNPETMSTDHNQFLNTLTRDILCPTCYVTMNLLRGGVLRILKDEESETKPENLGCDKSTEKWVCAMEKSTSFTNKTVPKISNLTLCDFISECSSDFSMPHDQTRSPHQVKFLDIEMEEKQKTVPMNDACLCLENFIDSIRPPLADSFYM